MERLICPICKDNLKKQEKKLLCKQKHSFDIAKQGYVNLHLSSKKASKNPGDDKAMVVARRDFLNSGFYEGISHEVNKQVKKYSKANMFMVDIGCGEGYYTKRAYDALVELVDNLELYALDISKEAVMLGAKSYKEINWLVASGAEMPFEDKSVDIALVMFTKVFGKEYKRILKDDGILIVVSPNRNHLVDIKEVVYDEVKFESYNPMVDLGDDFVQLENINVNYRKLLEGNSNIMNLFNMTPYRWRSPREGIERLSQTASLEVTVDVNIDIYTRVKGR